MAAQYVNVVDDSGNPLHHIGRLAVAGTLDGILANPATARTTPMITMDIREDDIARRYDVAAFLQELKERNLTLQITDEKPRTASMADESAIVPLLNKCLLSQESPYICVVSQSGELVQYVGKLALPANPNSGFAPPGMARAANQRITMEVQANGSAICYDVDALAVELTSRKLRLSTMSREPARPTSDSEVLSCLNKCKLSQCNIAA